MLKHWKIIKIKIDHYLKEVSDNERDKSIKEHK